MKGGRLSVLNISGMTIRVLKNEKMEVGEGWGYHVVGHAAES